MCKRRNFSGGKIEGSLVEAVLLRPLDSDHVSGVRSCLPFTWAKLVRLRFR